MAPGINIIAILLVGAVIGSFISALVERLPDCKGLVAGRSRCPDCGETLKVRDLIPLVSYLLLGGACRACGKAIAWVYPVAELGALFLALTVIVVFRDPATAPGTLWLASGLGWCLLALVLADVRRFLLPDMLVLPLMAAGIASVFLEPQAQWQSIGMARVFGAALGFGLMEAVRRLYFWIRGRDGLGFGDVKLMAAGGAWLGWPLLPHSLALAGILGLVTVLILRLTGRVLGPSDALPFGAFLAPAIWILWMLGKTAPDFIGILVGF